MDTYYAILDWLEPAATKSPINTDEESRFDTCWFYYTSQPKSTPLSLKRLAALRVDYKKYWATFGDVVGESIINSSNLYILSKSRTLEYTIYNLSITQIKQVINQCDISSLPFRPKYK